MPFSVILSQSSRPRNVLKAWRKWRCRMKNLRSWFLRGMKNRVVAQRETAERPAHHQEAIQSEREYRGTVWLKRLLWICTWATAYCSMVSVSIPAFLHTCIANLYISKHTTTEHALWCTVAYILAPYLLYWHTLCMLVYTSPLFTS